MTGGATRRKRQIRPAISAKARPLCQESWTLTRRPEDPHARAGAAAHAQSPAERAEPAQFLRRSPPAGHQEYRRRPVELRGKQVIAALNRRQRLHRQGFTVLALPART